jgi:pimeloyl-ACP methyl ester carboxylesterase
VTAAVERRQLAIGPRTISYLFASQAPGRHLAVFLHAFPLGAEMWVPQMQALPPGWTAVAPDFRGFGASTPDPPAAVRADATLDGYADDVEALLEALGAARAAVCGCSMGGYAALSLLRRAPDRIAGLLLADTRATGDSEAGRASRVAMLDLLDRQGPGAVAADMRAKLVGPTTQASRPAVVGAVEAMMRRATPAGVGFAVARMMNRPDSSAALASFRGPVCVVVGEEDALTPPAEAAAMAGLVPGAALVAIRGAGHLSNLESPEAFNAAMLDWLRAVDSAAAGPTNPESLIPNPQSRALR